jgi:heptosyltransferase-2
VILVWPCDTSRRLPKCSASDGRNFDIGIDVLGSAFGSLLLMRAEIPWRLGVDGYAGGQTGLQQSIQYECRRAVGRSALRFAELLGAKDLPGSRPQVFLSQAESDEAEQLWLAQTAPGQRRIVIAPGGGHPGRAWAGRSLRRARAAT